MTTAPTACGGINDISSTGTGEPARTPPAPTSRKPTSPLHSTQRAHHAAAMRATSTPRAPAAVTVAAHTPPPQQQPRPQSSTARAHATLHAARATRARIAPPPEQRRRTPRQQTPRTNDDTRRRKDAACPHGHKAEDADRWGKRKLGSRPGNGAPLRARARFPFPPMRAWLEQPHGRHHKAPPCILTTNARPTKRRARAKSTSITHTHPT